MVLSGKSVAATVSFFLAMASVPNLAGGNPLVDFANKAKSDFAAITAKAEQERAAIRAQQQSSADLSSATKNTQDEGGEQTIPLSIPKDKRVATAVDEALPTIKKVLSIHQCLKNNGGLREMNFYAVPGIDMSRYASPYWPTNNLPIDKMKFHDKNKCPRVQAVDQFSMPALNALLFRTVYFADDSGETSSFLYLFMRADDGSWKIKQLEEMKR